MAGVVQAVDRASSTAGQRIGDIETARSTDPERKGCVTYSALRKRCATALGPRRRTTLGSASAVTEMLSRPVSAKNSANSGWSLGAWPQSPTLRPSACAAVVTISISFLTPGRARRRDAPGFPNRGPLPAQAGSGHWSARVPEKIRPKRLIPRMICSARFMMWLLTATGPARPRRPPRPVPACQRAAARRRMPPTARVREPAPAPMSAIVVSCAIPASKRRWMARWQCTPDATPESSLPEIRSPPGCRKFGNGRLARRICVLP